MFRSHEILFCTRVGGEYWKVFAAPGGEGADPEGRPARQNARPREADRETVAVGSRFLTSDSRADWAAKGSPARRAKGLSPQPFL